MDDHYLKAELEARVRTERDIFEFVESALDGLWYWDLERPDEQWLSPRLKQVLGYEDDEVPNTSSWWRASVEPADLPAALHELEKHLFDPSQPYDHTLRHRHKNGSTVWIRCRGRVIHDSSGRAVRMLGVHRDVTAISGVKEARNSLEATREDYQRFRQLADSLPQLVWTCTPDGSCDYLSRQWLDYTGKSEQSQLGFGWIEQVHPEDRPVQTALWTAAVASGSPYVAEFRIRRHDGTYRWFDTRAIPLSGRGGQISKWFGSNTDITERRRAAEQLKKSQDQVETVISNLTEGLVISDLDGQLLHWNPAGLAMHGFASLEECLRKLPYFQEIFELSPVDGPVLELDEWPLSRIFRGELLRDVKLRTRRKDIEWERIFVFNGSIVREPNGEAVAFLTITDVTERERTTRALMENEQRLRIANEVAGVGSYEVDLKTQRVRFSPELCAMLELPAETEITVKEAFRLVHPEDVGAVERRFAESLTPEGKGLAAFELRVVKPNGEVRWLSWSSRVLYDESSSGATPARAIGACFDVTAHRLSERRLSTHNAVNSVLAEVANLNDAMLQVMRAICESEGWDFGAIWQVDEAAGSLRCSQIWHRPELPLQGLAAQTRALVLARGIGLPGRVWATGRPLLIRDVATDPTYRRTALALEHGLKSALAFPILLRGKVTVVIDFLGRLVQGPGDKVLETFAPISHQLGIVFERKRAEAERQELQTQLLQSQKMEALGQLSGGIAHDFNNMLAAILGNAELGLSELPEAHPVRENLRAIEEASQRAKQLILQILTFARQQHQERRVVKLGPLLEESLALLRATIPASVELSFAAEADVPEILADPTQIQQVLLNLATNAWHALEDGKGRIEIRLSSTNVDAPRARALSGVRPGRFARITIRDSGRGMEPAVVDRIFEPFFTTKGPGRGTGLGLSVVHGIVQNHEGAIQVSTRRGQGSTFVVYFPATQQVGQVEVVEAPQHEQGLGQRILYVDDEAQLISIAQRALSRLGYKVVGFTAPGLAIEAFRNHPNQFAAVVTDMNMPQFSGVQVARQLKSVRADVPIVLLSGHITDELKAAAEAAGIHHFLYKPCTMQELGEVVRKVLSDARA